jgi:hypothetical protein
MSSSFWIVEISLVPSELVMKGGLDLQVLRRSIRLLRYIPELFYRYILLLCVGVPIQTTNHPVSHGGMSVM